MSPWEPCCSAASHTADSQTDSKGISALDEGRPGAACADLARGIAVARDRATAQGWLPMIASVHAEAELARGAVAEAISISRAAIGRAREGKCFYAEATAQLWLAAALLTAGGEVPGAEVAGALERATALASRVDARSLEPRILELQGRLAAARGDTAGAEALLRRSLALFRAIGAACHADRVAAAMTAQM